MSTCMQIQDTEHKGAPKCMALNGAQVRARRRHRRENSQRHDAKHELLCQGARHMHCIRILAQIADVQIPENSVNLSMDI